VDERPQTAAPSPADLLAMMPFAAELGIAMDSATAGEVRGRLAWAPQRCTPHPPRSLSAGDPAAQDRLDPQRWRDPQR
jgi:hypothetical protein